MKKKKRRTAAATAATRKHSDAAASPQTQEQEAVVSPPVVETNSSGVSTSKLEKNAPSVNNDGGRIQTDASPLPVSEEPYHQPGADHDAARHDVDEAPDLFLSPQEATKVLERFFTVLTMANIPAHVVLKPFCGKRLAIEKIEQVLQQAGLPSDFVPMELKAFRSLAVSGSPKQESKSDCSYTVEAQVIFDQASAIAFRVEMCEFQIRSAVCKYAVGAAKVPKAKMDFQRIVAKLTSHLPAAGSSTSAAMITSSDFERLLEEKLGVMLGSFLVKIVFARVTGRPFQRSFPKVLEANKLAFCEVLERFCINKPLSVDSVEGQLRQLVIKFPDMRAVFQRMDLDSSGTISTQEFVAFLQKEGNMHFPDEVLTAFIKRFDFDGDGTLSYDEFIEFVRPKQFGVNVLSPFGMFYLAVDRLEKMSDVVEKVKTRMFWLQHNDLFAVASAASSASTGTASRVKGKPSQQSQQPTTKLKVTDRFILTHHFGARRLEFEPKDPIVNVLANGELVVLILAKDELLQSSGTLVAKSKSTNTNGRNDLSISPLPAFEYRLKPTTKRNLPPLFSTTEMMRSIEQKVSTMSSSS